MVQILRRKQSKSIVEVERKTLDIQRVPNVILDVPGENNGSGGAPGTPQGQNGAAGNNENHGAIMPGPPPLANIQHEHEHEHLQVWTASEHHTNLRTYSEQKAEEACLCSMFARCRTRH
uniref:Uncharacterized protein n=1 Tax=Cacopsylla melanoneura TaxID=428564 RepID=A0A8D9BHQ9_9HEMI